MQKERCMQRCGVEFIPFGVGSLLLRLIAWVHDSEMALGHIKFIKICHYPCNRDLCINF